MVKLPVITSVAKWGIQSTSKNGKICNRMIKKKELRINDLKKDGPKFLHILTDQ